MKTTSLHDSVYKMCRPVRDFLKDGPAKGDSHKRDEQLLSMVHFAARSPKIILSLQWSMAALVVAGVSIGLWFVFLSRTAPLTFTVGDSANQAAVGTVVHTRQYETIPIVFSTGSRFDVKGDSKVSVVQVDKKEVRVELNNGHVVAVIRGKGKTQWSVNARGYLVSALGTVFEVSTNDGGGFDVTVTEGTVMVEGPGLEKGGLVLAKGNCFSANPDNQEFHKRKCTDENQPGRDNGAGYKFNKIEKISKEEVGSPLEKSDIISVQSKSKIKESFSTKGTRAADIAGAKDWREQARQGNYKNALSLLTKKDIIWIEQKADVDLLWQMIRTARYHKRGDIAMRWIHAMRVRFPSHTRAKTVAFIAAKIKMDFSNDLQSSIWWLKVYLKENPEGSLAEETIGHLMTFYERSGNIKEARKYARVYLGRYNGGAFSEHAQNLAKP